MKKITIYVTDIADNAPPIFLCPYEKNFSAVGLKIDNNGLFHEAIASIRAQDCEFIKYNAASVISKVRQFADRFAGEIHSEKFAKAFQKGYEFGYAWHTKENFDNKVDVVKIAMEKTKDMSEEEKRMFTVGQMEGMRMQKD